MRHNVRCCRQRRYCSSLRSHLLGAFAAELGRYVATGIATWYSLIMSSDDLLSFDAGLLIDPSIADDPASVAALTEGTYRSNWSRLKVAAYSTTFCSVANMANLLLPAAGRIVENIDHPAERAFMLGFNHNRLVGGPALGAIGLIAFAQESFVRLAYQLALELRLQRSRAVRANGLEETLAIRIADFEQKTFGERCRALLAELRAPNPRGSLQKSSDLMLFRNSIAHDSPLLSDVAGKEIVATRGKAQERRSVIGSFSTLESETCPVRLRHIKSAIDAHDELVEYCLRQATRAGWVAAIDGFADGIGLRMKDVYSRDGWYKTLGQLSRHWEKEFQPHATASLSSLIEMRNALNRRAAMRRS